MTKKMKSTVDEFMDSMNPKEKKEFDEGLRDLVLSELIMALMDEDELSVRKLAKIAGVSPTVVQAMRTGSKKDFSMQSFFKVLRGLGCKKLMVEFNGGYISLAMPATKKQSIK